MQELYIRQPESEEALGPYELGHIGDLIDAGKADTTTLYFDEEREDWIPLTDNPDYREILFPEKRRLGLRAKEITDVVNEEDSFEEEVSVDKMLNDAEGTDKTRARERNISRGAKISSPTIGFAMLLSAAAVLWPQFDFIALAIEEGNYGALATETLLYIGVIDLFIALCSFLGAADIYPFLRFRMMLGIGLFGYSFWAWGQPEAAIAVVGASLALAIQSLLTNFWTIVFFAIVSLGGFGFTLVSSIMASLPEASP